MTVSHLRPICDSDSRAASLRRSFAPLLLLCAALTPSARAFAGELTITTEDSLKLDGFQKSTQMCGGSTQSAEMLLSRVGRKELSEAIATTKSNSTMLRLDQGWAFVRVLCDGEDVREASPESETGGPEDVETMEPEKESVVPGWVFILIRNNGAGAEGTDFIAELEGDITHFYSHEDNTSHVWLAIACPTLALPDRTKTLELLPDQYARVEPDATNNGHHLVNGVSCCILSDGHQLPAEPVPTGKRSFHSAAWGEVAANGY